jgi:tetratricopeptide (TPR) repeat protein
MSDGNKEVVTICEEELHRSKAWAYKWLARFKREGLDGLKDKPRSGIPLAVPEQMLLKLRRELSGNAFNNLGNHTQAVQYYDKALAIEQNAPDILILILMAEKVAQSLSENNIR